MTGHAVRARRLPPLTIMGWLRFDAIRRAVERVRPASVVELGCGQGAVGSWLAAHATYVGVEPDDMSRCIAEQQLSRFPRGSVVPTLDVVDGTTADLGCAFEVLEHIDDDVEALIELSSKVRAGGAVLLSVPAHPDRFGASDELVGHHRRYSRGALVALLHTAGLAVETFESYGAGGGQALDRIQDVLAERRLRALPGRIATAAVGTAGSGRYRQPGSGTGVALRAAVAAPLRVAQVPFRATDVGIGYVTLARTCRDPA